MNKIVLFYSDNCGPCNSLRPVLEEVLMEKNIDLEKVCVDSLPGIKHAELHGVNGWPTVYAVAGDIIIGEMVGADTNATEEQHRNRIEEELIWRF